MTDVLITLPDGSQVTADSNQTELVHGVDEDGEYLGLVDVGDAFEICCGPPPQSSGWRWQWQGGWTPVVTLEAAKAGALELIDRCAGSARLKYITEVPGQAGTYIVKAEQAQAFIDAGGEGDPPPYVQAEADATGLTLLEAAQYIAGVAALWSEQLGPAIERERRRGKVNVQAATTVEEVQTALADAQEALSLI